MVQSKRKDHAVNVEEWGWERKNDEYVTRWMTLPEASKACQELVNEASLNNVQKEGVNVERVILLALTFVIAKVVANDKRIKKFESNIYSNISFI